MFSNKQTCARTHSCSTVPPPRLASALLWQRKQGRRFGTFLTVRPANRAEEFSTSKQSRSRGRSRASLAPYTLNISSQRLHEQISSLRTPCSSFLVMENPNTAYFPTLTPPTVHQLIQRLLSELRVGRLGAGTHQRAGHMGLQDVEL